MGPQCQQLPVDGPVGPQPPRAKGRALAMGPRAGLPALLTRVMGLANEGSWAGSANEGAVGSGL